MNQKKILIVDDEPGLIMTLTDFLTSENYRVESAADGESGLKMAIENDFDLIILDLMLPRKSGLDICRDLRARSNHTPIMMLTARGETIDKILGLKIGADDYLTKPFDVMELLARVESLLRRTTPTNQPRKLGDVFRFGNIVVDFRRTEVQRSGEPVDMSALEFRLLHFLIENRGMTLSRDILLDAVWGYDAMPSSRTVDVHIVGLRQKLEENPRHPRFILTAHGFGYKFAE
jgi:two-component system alkaline phosphatase synthesis response regulator PhoP